MIMSGQGVNNDLDQKYTPNTNSVFNTAFTKGSGSSGVDIRNSLKFCPTFVIRQKLVFFYERSLGKGLALHFGAGKAFGTDIVQNAGFLLTTFEAPRTLSPNDIITYSDYTSSSMMISVGPKLYFSGDNFDGSYIELYYRRERMNYTLKDRVHGFPIEGGYEAVFKMNAFGFGYGFHSVTGAHDNITHDFFMQFGMKLFQFSEFTEETSSSSISSTYYSKSNLLVPVRMVPAINVGYSFGFGF